MLVVAGKQVFGDDPLELVPLLPRAKPPATSVQCGRLLFGPKRKRGATFADLHLIQAASRRALGCPPDPSRTAERILRHARTATRTA